MESDTVINGEAIEENDPLMTVQEYALIKGCSPSAVYQRIANGKLDNYLVMQENRKLLLRQLLKDEDLNEVDSRFKANYNPCQVKGQFKIDSRLDRLEMKVDSLTETITVLTREITELKAVIQANNEPVQALNKGETETNAKKPWWKLW